MKLATFEISTPAGPLPRIGAAVDGRLVDFSAAYAAHLDRADPGCDAQRLASLLFPGDMVAFIGAGDVGRRAADEAVNAAAVVDEAFGARTSYRPNEVRLLAPVTRPRVIRDFLTFEGHTEFYQQNHVVWKRIKAGFIQREKKYGVSKRYLNAFAFMAGSAPDRATTRVLMSKIGDQWDPIVWQEKHYFDGYKKWANQN